MFVSLRIFQFFFILYFGFDDTCIWIVVRASFFLLMISNVIFGKNAWIFRITRCTRIAAHVWIWNSFVEFMADFRLSIVSQATNVKISMN